MIFIKKILIEGNSGVIVKDLENCLKKHYEKQNKKFNNKELNQECGKILSSLVNLYEFLDRSMKGLLTGDISYHLIKNAKEIIEKAQLELKIIDEEFEKSGIEPHEFYESFFKIDDKFYQSNKTSNLTLNLAKNIDDGGHTNKRLLYFVNMKHTQFFDLFKTQMKKLSLVKTDVSEEDIKSMIDEKKSTSSAYIQ